MKSRFFRYRHALLFSTLFCVGCSFGGSEQQEEQRTSNPELPTVAKHTGFSLTTVPSRELHFLQSYHDHVESTVLLRDEDRVAAVFWYQSDEVAGDMNQLTEELFSRFSPRMHGLVDEVIQREGFAPIDILSFTDPVFSNEQFVFVRIRNSLYEFHVSEEKEGWVQGLLLELAREN